MFLCETIHHLVKIQGSQKIARWKLLPVHLFHPVLLWFVQWEAQSSCLFCYELSLILLCFQYTFQDDVAKKTCLWRISICHQPKQFVYEMSEMHHQDLLIHLGHLLDRLHSSRQWFQFYEEVLGLPDTDGFFLDSKKQQQYAYWLGHAQSEVHSGRLSKTHLRMSQIWNLAYRLE